MLSGDWLGLFKKKEECYKLARIAIDLPNSQDAEWQIDIKKSKAYPPSYCREQIEQYAKKVRTSAMEVFKHRGKILKHRAGQEFYPLWDNIKKDSNWAYVINRDNPILEYYKKLAETRPHDAIDQLLSLIESNVPTKTIFINEANDEAKCNANEIIDIASIQQPLKALYDSFINQGKSSLQAKALLKLIEPFNYYEDFIDTL